MNTFECLYDSNKSYVTTFLKVDKKHETIKLIKLWMPSYNNSVTDVFSIRYNIEDSFIQIKSIKKKIDEVCLYKYQLLFSVKKDNYQKVWLNN